MKKNINHILYLKSIKELNTLNKCINDKILPNYKDCLCIKGSENGDYLIEVDNEFLDTIGKVNSNLAEHKIKYCYTPSTSNFMIKDEFGNKVTYLDPSDVMNCFFNRYENSMKTTEKSQDDPINRDIPQNCLCRDPILISLTNEQDHVLSVIEQMYQKFIYKKVTPWEKEWRSDGSALVGRSYKPAYEACTYSVYAFDRERIFYLIQVLSHGLDVCHNSDYQFNWYDRDRCPRLVQIIRDGRITTTSIQDYFNSTLEFVRQGLISHPVD